MLPRGHYSRITALPSAPPTSIAVSDGEVIVYRRSRSLLYQCRYKLADGAWIRQTTGKAALEQAIARACDLYGEARYRQRLGLAHRTHLFAHIAQACVGELRQQIDLRGKKTALNDYVSCIERYFIPYFGERSLETLTASDIADFEVWRDRQLQRRPKTSTLNNFTSACVSAPTPLHCAGDVGLGFQVVSVTPPISRAQVFLWARFFCAFPEGNRAVPVEYGHPQNIPGGR